MAQGNFTVAGTLPGWFLGPVRQQWSAIHRHPSRSRVARQQRYDQRDAAHRRGPHWPPRPSPPNAANKLRACFFQLLRRALDDRRQRAGDRPPRNRWPRTQTLCSRTTWTWLLHRRSATATSSAHPCSSVAARPSPDPARRSSSARSTLSSSTRPSWWPSENRPAPYQANEPAPNDLSPLPATRWSTRRSATLKLSPVLAGGPGARRFATGVPLYLPADPDLPRRAMTGRWLGALEMDADGMS